MQNSAFDAILPPLAGIDRFKVQTTENTRTAYFHRLRDAVDCARMFRGSWATVTDDNGRILYSVGGPQCA